MDRQHVCDYIQRNWPDIQKEAIARTTAAMSMMTADQICNRFMEAGLKYGEFNINSINVDEELLAEFCDIPSYVALEQLKEE